MTAEGGAPATRRRISERLRDRLSGFVCIRTRAFELEMDRGGWGGSVGKRFSLSTLAQLIIEFLDHPLVMGALFF
jgi:hypothetical protein